MCQTIPRPGVFVIAAPTDEAWLQRLALQLKVLAEPHGFDIWHLGHVPAGEITQDWLETGIGRARVALILVSAELLTAEAGEVHARALRRAVELHEQRQLTLVPVITRPVTWQAVAWLSEMQPRPRGGRALSLLSRREAEEALSGVAGEVAQRLCARAPAKTASAAATVAARGSPFARFGAGLRRHAPALLVSALVAAGAHSLHLFEGLETPVLDRWLTLGPPPDTGAVAVVDIDDADYDELFGAQSPLDPARLFALIDVVARAHPAVIGVCVDTSAPAFAQQRLSPDWPVVVWAQGAREPHPDRGLEPQPVLGRAATGHALLAGLALARPAGDGFLRAYERLLVTASGRTLPSFAVQLATQLCLKQPGRCPRWHAPTAIGAATPLRWDEGGRIWRRTASHVMAAAADGWPVTNPLAGRVVLIGGTYAAAKDLHDTPAGPQPGVMVQARALAAELVAPPPPAWPRTRLLASAGAFAGVVAWLGWTRRTRVRGFWLVACGALLPLASLAACGSAARWPSFALVPLGLGLHRWRHERQARAARQAARRSKGGSHA